MAVCKFYRQGHCKFGDRCRYEHPAGGNGGENQGRERSVGGGGANVGGGGGGRVGGGGKGGGRRPSKAELWEYAKDAVGKGLWPLTSFGVDGEESFVKGDVSMDELRVEAYGSGLGFKDVGKKEQERFEEQRRRLTGQKGPPQEKSQGKGAGSSVFGGGASTSAKAPFGEAAMTSSSTPFGAQNKGFGATNVTASSAFGATNVTASSVFGAPPKNAVSPNNAFGASTNVFGSRTNTTTPSNVFGAPANATAPSNAFGVAKQPMPPNGFVAPSNTHVATSNPFGAPTTTNTTVPNNPFGAATTNLTPDNAFGSPATSRPPINSFGASISNTTPFGASTTPPTNAFGGTVQTAFGKMAGSSPFGSTSSPAFGNAATSPFPTSNTTDNRTTTESTSKVESLSPEDRAQFEAATFTVRKVPLVPPPPELC